MASILLVDDSSTMRKIIGRSLRQAGIDFDNIFEASDGLEALERIEEHKPDIMVLDVMMPNLDGISLCRILRGGTLCDAGQIKNRPRTGISGVA